MTPIKYNKITFAGLAEFEITVELVFQKIMQDLFKDCINRPYDKTKRKCKLTFCIEPVLDESTGQLDHCKIVVEGRPGIPLYRTKPIPVLVDHHGLASYNRDLPPDLDQQSLFNPGDE